VKTDMETTSVKTGTETEPAWAPMPTVAGSLVPFRYGYSESKPAAPEEMPPEYCASKPYTAEGPE